MMKCICGSENVSHIGHPNGRFEVIEHYYCEECGEIWFNFETLKKYEYGKRSGMLKQLEIYHKFRKMTYETMSEALSKSGIDFKTEYASTWIGGNSELRGKRRNGIIIDDACELSFEERLKLYNSVTPDEATTKTHKFEDDPMSYMYKMSNEDFEEVMKKFEEFKKKTN